MHTLHIALLGDFRLVYGTELLTSVNTPRLQALLVYLLLHRQAPQPRQHIAFQFWPDSSEKQAHTNLRKLLFQLRNALPDADRFLVQDHLTVHWRPDAPFTLDLAELQSTMTRCFTGDGKPLAQATFDDLSKVVTLYQGELAPGCFDEWLLPLRQQLHASVINTIEQLITLTEHQREYQIGIRYAQHLLGLDPLHETAYRRLMKLHALNGDRAAALQHYHACATILQRELGVEPDEETQAIYTQLLQPEDRLGTATMTARFDTPLVGRTTEWCTLLTVWQKVQRGETHFVAIAGEAGIGKTRLAEELLTWAADQGIRVARTRSYEAEGSLVFAPITEWLRSDALRPALKKLDKLYLSEVTRLLPELLTEQPQITQPAPLNEAWQRQRFFEALARALLVERSPLLLLIDDLQWCDGETLTWLRFLLRYDSRARLLVVGNWRSEAVDAAHPLSSLLRDLANANQLTTLELAPLTMQETSELVQQIADREITVSEIQQLFAITEGHPLFVVETVRAHSEGGSQSLPAKVQNVIQARLAQLSAEARDLAGLAATIGRRFSLDVINHASLYPDATLVRALDELWQRRIVREVGAGDYDFTHDRIREVAYQSLSRVWRRFLHRRVAEALEQRHNHELDKFSGELATHFERALLADKALHYYQQAATSAFRLHAPAEVNNFCKHGLRLLDTYPDLQNHLQYELTLIVMLTAAAAAGAQGYSAQEVGEFYERALRILKLVEPDERTISIYYGLWGYYFNSSAFDRADGLAEEMPEQAKRLNDPFLLELAHHGRGMTLLYRGSPAMALALYAQSLGFAQNTTRQGETFQQSQTLTMMTHSFRAIALLIQGYPDQARAAMQEALRLQTEQWTPLNQVVSYTLASVLNIYLRDKANTFAYAQAAVEICNRYDLFYWRLFATISLLWAESERGANAPQGVELLSQLLEHIVNSGTSTSLPFNFLLLADMQQQIGKINMSIATVRRSLALVEKSGERWWEAENHRFLGELLLEAQDTQEAETHLQHALEISQSQGTKAFELRAATSLARLWHRQGRTELACDLLTPIYDWFTEGFDTLDLIEAKALLETFTTQD